MGTLRAALSLRTKPPRSLLAKASMLIGILVFIAMTALLGFRIKSELEKANQTRCIGNMKQLGLSLSEYREKFDGEYPQDIKVLESSGMVQNLEQLTTARGGKGQWIYFPDQISAWKPLLVSPEIGQKKVILYPDMTVRLEPIPKPFFV